MVSSRKFVVLVLVSLAVLAAGSLVPSFVPGPIPLLLALKLAFEGVCVLYAVAFCVAAFRYLKLRKSPAARPETATQYPSAAVIYLCCGDLDRDAVESLSEIQYSGPLLHILHDDSTALAANQKVDQAVREIGEQQGIKWQVLRRPEHIGGKPGALEYVLERTAHQHEFFLLADNDSFVEDPGVLEHAIDSFADPAVAIVQFRNCCRSTIHENEFSRTLAGAIDIFDAFMLGLFELLWMPFVGHNAVLRTRSVLEAGGFTPGFFADDIDLTVRLSLKGHRVVYRRDLRMTETHPSNYRSLCARSRKWAIGCAQVLRAHLGSVIASRNLLWREKLGFVVLTGFYVTQVIMLSYVMLTLLVLPPLLSGTTIAPWWAFAIGTLVPVTIFAPTVAYLVSEGRDRPFWRTLMACTLTYGTTDLWTTHGVFSGLRSRERRWVPTNSIEGGRTTGVDWLHFGLGCSFLGVPLVFQPELLLFPLTWIFPAKFLFVPAVATAYAAQPTRSLGTVVKRAASIGGLLLVCALATAAHAQESSTRGLARADAVEIRDGKLWLGDAAPTIRGIHYSPWRSGTGPGKNFPYPSDAQLREDFELISRLSANAVLVYEAPLRLLDLAHEFDLRVLYVFDVLWNQLGADPEAPILPHLDERVEALASHRALLGWMVGNEAPAWVIDRLTPNGIRGILGTLRERIRAAGSGAPVCYGNWPLARTLDLDRDLDLLCYNVYPFFPPEVAARGYATYVRDEIVSRARGRPVLITEFGTNTVEVSPAQQASITRACWEGLLSAGAQGGMVFSFADEAWKNYDNPMRAPDWWRREGAVDDHLSFDEDPEEHYGIVHADRSPKPAFAAVESMFEHQVAVETGSTPPQNRWQRIAAGLFVGLILVALAVRWRIARGRSRVAQRQPHGQT